MKDRCFILKDYQGGGGGPNFRSFVLRRSAAIGDAICATIVADKLMDQGYPVVFQTHSDIHCILRRHPRLAGVTVPGGFCHINLDGAYERDAGRRRKTFSQMFMDVANYQLANVGMNLGPALNCKPKLSVETNLKAAAYERFKSFPRPWVFICPRSEYYRVRHVPDDIWDAAAARIHGSKFWLGRHPGPPGIHDLSAQHMDNVLVWLSVADLLVTVDTGPMHIAAALGIPVVAINQSSSPHLHLNDQNDFVEVSPPLACLNCQQNICPLDPHIPPCQRVDPDLIAAETNRRLRSLTSEDVSAVISVYRPDVNTLNRCLECVLPQVAEVVLCADQMGIVPQGTLDHEKIRRVLSPQTNIGYGRKQNFAARHASGKYLLLMNDDVFLAPDAVEKMVVEMKPGVGIVSNLLRYPDGTIYHSGKVRGVNEKGWGHCNYKHLTPYFTQPTEIENCCGACILVNRKAFFEIDGFDEEFYLYAEDDDFSLKMRRAGYKILFTPFSEGVHLEHQSTNKTGDIYSLVRAANTVFDRKWRRYLEWNANRVPLGNFEYEH